MTEEQKNVIIKCRNSGLGYATIAKDIGLTKDTVGGVLQAEQPDREHGGESAGGDRQPL